MANEINAAQQNISQNVRIYQMAGTGIGTNSGLARSLFSFTLKKMSNYGTILAAKATSANLAHAIVEGGVDIAALVTADDPDFGNAGVITGVADTAIVAVNQAVTVDLALDKDSNAISF
tara:strand:+ start:232 stop:588 length:357 start_codon:yes stop_codon:yes gene_type:complete